MFVSQAVSSGVCAALWLQIVRISEQVSYEEKRGAAKELADKQAQLAAYKQKLVELKQQEQELDQQVEQVTQQVQDLTQSMDDLRAKVGADSNKRAL